MKVHEGLRELRRLKDNASAELEVEVFAREGEAGLQAHRDRVLPIPAIDWADALDREDE